MKIREFVTVLALAAVLATGLYAQETAPKASLHVWSDEFAGPDGPVAYPQYGWRLKVPTGTLSGYGLASVVPHEKFFTNHLVVYTPSIAPWFSVHTETGGNPIAGGHFHQIGPRVNIANVVPKLKSMDHLFVAVLPRFIGVRPNNILLSGATNPFKVTKSVQMSVEGYRRFFPHGGYYGEYWVLAHPKQTKQLSYGIFIANDSNQKVVIGVGGRISLF